MKRGFICLLFAILFVGKAFPADIELYSFEPVGTPDRTVFVRIDGPIRSGDEHKFLEKYYRALELNANNSPNMRFVSVHLNSPGGDVQTAMAIGREIRKLRLATIVGKNSICNSACALTYAAGVIRITHEKIGIHRPYLIDVGPNRTEGEIQLAFTRILLNIKSYLRDLWIKESFAEDMFTVDPQNIRYLDVGELKQYGLTFSDPVYDEISRIETLRKNNLSQEEYTKKMSEIRIICRSSPEVKVDQNEILRIGRCAEEILRRR